MDVVERSFENFSEAGFVTGEADGEEGFGGREEPEDLGEEAEEGGGKGEEEGEEEGGGERAEEGASAWDPLFNSTPPDEDADDDCRLETPLPSFGPLFAAVFEPDPPSVGGGRVLLAFINLPGMARPGTLAVFDDCADLGAFADGAPPPPSLLVIFPRRCSPKWGEEPRLLGLFPSSSELLFPVGLIFPSPQLLPSPCPADLGEVVVEDGPDSAPSPSLLKNPCNPAIRIEVT